jgi:hypothetical protein
MGMGVWAHVPCGGRGGLLGVFSTALRLTPPTSVTTAAVTDFFFSIFALFLDTIHACMQFVLIIFTHPSLTLSNSLGTPSSSQQALLILCLG